MIDFTNVPTDIRTPGSYIEVDNSNALEGLPTETHRVLILGGRLSSGLGTSNTLYKLTSIDQAESLFGRGSTAHRMVAAFRQINTSAELWAVGISDHGSGVAATGTIVIGGSGASAGTIHLLVAGRYIPVAVESGDATTAIASNVADAVNAVTDLPVTASVSSSTVTLTARNKGVPGNSIDIRVNYYPGQLTPAGVTVTITAMASGATNPSLSTAITAMADEQFHTVVTAWIDDTNLTALEAELERRFGPTVQKEGQAFAAARDTYSNLLTLGDARNSQFLSIMGSQSPTPPWEVAAVVAALDAGEADPARPRQTLWLKGVLAPARSAQFTRDERDLLLRDGISTFVVDANGRCLIERLITTYQVNGLGTADTSYLDIETMRTLAYIRFAVRTRIALRFPRHKLANDGTRIAPGQAVVTPRVIRAELIGLFSEMEQRGLVEDMAAFKAELRVERNADDPNRVDAVLPPNLVNQFRVFGVRLSFKL